METLLWYLAPIIIVGTAIWAGGPRIWKQMTCDHAFGDDECRKCGTPNIQS